METELVVLPFPLPFPTSWGKKMCIYMGICACVQEEEKGREYYKK